MNNAERDFIGKMNWKPKRLRYKNMVGEAVVQRLALLLHSKHEWLSVCVSPVIVYLSRLTHCAALQTIGGHKTGF